MERLIDRIDWESCEAILETFSLILSPNGGDTVYTKKQTLAIDLLEKTKVVELDITRHTNQV